MKGNMKADQAVPGPGTYNPLHPIGTDCLSFKLKGKLTFGDADQVARSKDVPPPGHYED